MDKRTRQHHTSLSATHCQVASRMLPGEPQGLGEWTPPHRCSRRVAHVGGPWTLYMRCQASSDWSCPTELLRSESQTLCYAWNSTARFMQTVASCHFCGTGGDELEQHYLACAVFRGRMVNMGDLFEPAELMTGWPFERVAENGRGLQPGPTQLCEHSTRGSLARLQA